tara:strand:- start:259 stop:774 length:516 start_codon:yes stop_codon:yes gene_type:complete
MASSFSLAAKAINSCTAVSVQAVNFSGDKDVGQIRFTHLSTRASYTTDMHATGSTMTIPVSNLPSASGVYTVESLEGNRVTSRVPLILHCDIDCCLAKLTNELIDCACDCPKCSVTLGKAQKVFLLLQSAVSASGDASTQIGSQNSGYYKDILEKYNKAKSICDNSCGCNC